MRISLLLISLSLLIILCTAQQHLQRFIADLSAFSRITNAIVIQNAAFQKSIKIREMTAELIDVGVDSMSGFMGQDVQKIIVETKRIFEAIDNATEPQSSLDDLEKYADMFYLLEDVFNFVKEDFNQDIVSRHFQTVKNHIDNFKEKCDADVFIAARKFWTFIKLNPGATSEKRKSALMRFKQHSNRISKCMEDLADTGETISLNMQDGDVAEQFVSYKEQLDNWIRIQPDFQSVSGFLTQLWSDLQALNALGNPGRMGEELIRIANFHRNHDDDSSRTSAYTKAFPNGITDFSQVLMDLKSAWFQKKIARGKSTEDLEKALEFFGKAAKELEKIEPSWKAYALMNHSLVDGIGKALRTMEEIGDAGRNGTMGSFGPSFRTCLQQGPLEKIDEVRMAQIDQVLPLSLVAAEDMKSVEHAMQKLKIVKSMKSVFNRIAALIPDNWRGSDPELVRNTINNDREIDKLLELLSDLEDVNEIRQRLFQAKKKLQILDSHQTYLKSPADKTEMPKITECLKNAKFQPAAVQQAVEYVQSFKTLKQHVAQMNYTQEYLEKVDEFQKQVFQVERAVTAMGAATTSPSTLMAQFENTETLAVQLAEGVVVLQSMASALEHRKDITLATNFPVKVNTFMQRSATIQMRAWWAGLTDEVNDTMTELQELDKTLGQIGKLEDYPKAFKEAEKVEGVEMFRPNFAELAAELERHASTDPEFVTALNTSRTMSQYDLNFAQHRDNLEAAYFSTGKLLLTYEELFGFRASKHTTNFIAPWFSYSHVILLCCACFVAVVLAAIIIYGLTANGRRRYRNLYLYYFPNKAEFEKRWRYSLFMDRENGHNALIDASREINHINVRNILAKGAYINVYSAFGNTPLHMATNRGFPKVVEVLIKNGANRGLLNGQNKTAEQLIPKIKPETPKEDAENFKRIRQIYDKYRKKSFRIQVPQVFPTHLFHICIEKRTNDEVTNAFTKKYQGITFDEPNITTTHLVCSVGEDGVLETDDIAILVWIFNGIIMVKESWMTDCLEDDRAISRDANYLVEDVKYRGVLYENCVLPWSRAQSKGEMPFLYGAYVVFVAECPKMPIYTALIQFLGGVILQQFPSKDSFNVGSHPYLHTNLGPLFIIHDGKMDLTVYKNDTDGIYSLFTEQEFVALLLKRNIQQETNMDPLSQLSTTTTTERQQQGTSSSSGKKRK